MLTVLLLTVIAGGVAGSATRAECAPGALDQVLNRLARDENIELSAGVKLVKVGEFSDGEQGRSSKDFLWSLFKKFFANYELQVKLSDIFQGKQEVIDRLRGVIISLNQLQEGNEEASRGKGSGGFGGGKKSGQPILVMATMMGGMMAALGYGALGMLVMKALTVSSMALLLSAVIGLRRLLRRPDDDGGFGRISYIPVHTEHRKRRSFHDVPYRAHAKHAL